MFASKGGGLWRQEDGGGVVSIHLFVRAFHLLCKHQANGQIDDLQTEVNRKKKNSEVQLTDFKSLGESLVFYLVLSVFCGTSANLGLGFTTTGKVAFSITVAHSTLCLLIQFLNLKF